MTAPAKPRRKSKKQMMADVVNATVAEAKEEAQREEGAKVDPPPAKASAEDLARQFVQRDQVEAMSDDTRRKYLQYRLRDFIDKLVAEKILRDEWAVKQREAMIEYDRHRVKMDKLQLVVNRIRRKLAEA